MLSSIKSKEIFIFFCYFAWTNTSKINLIYKNLHARDNFSAIEEGINCLVTSIKSAFIPSYFNPIMEITGNNNIPHISFNFPYQRMSVPKLMLGFYKAFYRV